MERKMREKTKKMGRIFLDGDAKVKRENKEKK